MNSEKKVSQIVYVVVGQKYTSMSERVKKLVSLRGSFEKLILFIKGKNHSDPNIVGVSPIPNPTGVLRVLGLLKIKKKIDRYLFFPSPIILYVKRVQKKIGIFIERDLEEGKNICLITSVPPHDVCLIGLYLKKKYPQIYWIVDWRDLWSYDENYFKKTPGIYRGKLLSLEKEILNNCDINVTTNSYAKGVLTNHYHVPHQYVVCINQSFSRDEYHENMMDVDKYISAGKNKEIKIGFLGTLFKPPKVPGERVLKAIRYVRKSGINVKLHHYGRVPDSVRKSLNGGKGDDIVFHGLVRRAYGLREISQCHFLLLVLADMPNSKSIMHLKLPDYFLLRRPIIAIVPEPSAISDVIRKANCGYVIPANQDWGVGLESLMREVIKGVGIPERNEEEIERYDWQNVSRQWMSLINRHHEIGN